jgi:hypothetical protein
MVDLQWPRAPADLGRWISAVTSLLRARHGGPSLSSEHGAPSLSLVHRSPDPASNRPPAADLTTGGGGGADPITSSGGGADPATTERIRPLAAAVAWILPRATMARGTGLSGLLGSVGFFYFVKLLTEAGYLTQPPPLIALTEGVVLRRPPQLIN